MKMHSWYPTLLLAGGIALVAGCAGAPPVATSGQVDQPAATRQLLDAESGLDEASFTAIQAQLPKQIDPATAQRVLVKIDPNQIAASRSLQWIGGWGGRGLYGRFGAFGLGYPFSAYNYGAYSYYPYGNYAFPYAYGAGVYSPYTYGAYSPFFTYRSSIYRPYFYRRW